MKTIMTIFLLITNIIGIKVTEKNSIKDTSARNVANYLKNNKIELSNELYNMGIDLYVSKIDSYLLFINTFEEKKEGQFIIINDGDFYMLIGDGLVLYDYGIDCSASLLLLISDGKAEFDSILCKYYYYDDNNVCSFDIEHENISWDNYGMSKKYNGQDKDGYIYDSEKYVKDRYGEKFLLSKSNRVVYYEGSRNHPNYMEGFDQLELSCYTYGGSENNCCIVAPYTIANYIIKSRYKKLKYVTTNNEIYDPETSETYIYYDKMIYSTKYKLREEYQRNWCELYRKTRIKAYEKYGAVENLSISQSSGLIESVLKDYDILINAKEEGTLLGYDYRFYKEIDNGNPLMASLLEVGAPYNMHTFCIAGYEYWEKKDKWWIFTNTQTKIIAEIRDGFSQKAYYDVSACTGSLFFSRIVYK